MVALNLPKQQSGEGSCQSVYEKKMFSEIVRLENVHIVCVSCQREKISLGQQQADPEYKFQLPVENSAVTG